MRQVYEFLAAKLAESGRSHWVEEELHILTNPGTYIIEPQNAWKRIKTRTNSGKFLAIVQALAAFREEFAQTRNVPRNRVYKDDALVELASNKPKSYEELGRSRLLLREARKGEIADGILAAVQAGLNCPPEKAPKAPTGRAAGHVPVRDQRVFLSWPEATAAVSAKFVFCKALLHFC